MDHQQVIALIVIAAFIIGLFAYAYHLGRLEGHTRGRLASDREHHETIKRHEAALELLRNDHRHLAAHAKKLRAASTLSPEHLNTLTEAAEALRIAAETWSAFKTGKKLERNARRLREETLALATLHKPVEQEAAA